MRKKICFIISNIDKALAFEWTAELLKDHYDLSFILIGKPGSQLALFLQKNSISVTEFAYSGKRNFVKTFFKTCLYLFKNKPDIVHTHLLDASLIGLTAALVTGVKKRIYTRHHSDYHFVYAPQGIKYDKWCNLAATKIVAISKNVANLLTEREKVPANKVTLIYHGFNLQLFEQPDPETVAQLQQRYNPQNKFPVVGVIARQTHFKGIQYIIPAFAKLLQIYPTALLILANAHGDFEAEITRLCSEMLPATSICTIKFENKIESLYQIFTVYVHTPVTASAEAFGQTYVEALAAGIPSVFSLSGIAAEFIVHERNALVVPFCNTEAIFLAIQKLLSDNELSQHLVAQGRQDVHRYFELQTMINKLTSIYNA
ncbi:glycosyltransferase family 1 protein [Sphingobacteriales bacterium UPWRP_1]|nr:hypothetical protein BVG80_04805 [Sphingobacteriales bacterium TSM_CSM]PSJ76210.1 glycosyltransferase family 1 protein [Sphingobacteriales bacterium UPWRP_1]